MTREQRVEKLLSKLTDEEFRYGKTDCFHFTARLVKEWHGKDFRPLHRYKSQREAIEYLRAHGGLERLVTGTLGYPLRSAADAQDGDVVTAEVSPGQIALGFALGGKAWFKTKSKVVAVKLSMCQSAWRIS